MKVSANMPVKIDQFLIGNTLTIYETYNSKGRNMGKMRDDLWRIERLKFGMKVKFMAIFFIGDDFISNRFTIKRTFIGNPDKVQFFSLN